MPLIKGDELAIFQGLDPSREFKNGLPEGNYLSPTADAFQKTQFLSGYYRNCIETGSLLGARLAQTVGVPEFRLEDFAAMYSGRVSAESEVMALAQSQVMGAAIKLWQRAFADAISDVPVLGWAVGVGTFLVDWISSLVSAFRPDEPSPTAAQVYNKSNDTSSTDQLLTMAASRDWTFFFLPPVKSPTFESETISWTGEGAEGRRFRPGFIADPTGDLNGAGILPGISDRVGDYQYPYKQPRSNREANPKTQLETWGRLMPSTTQFGTMAWEAVMKPSVQMFSVDIERVISEWETWYGELADFAESQTGQLRRMATYAARWWDSDPDYDYASDAAGAGKRKWKQYGPDNVPSQYAANRLTSSLIRYICHGVLYPRMRPTLRTIVCAYVGPDAPGLRYSPGLRPMQGETTTLKQFHHEMRQLLLTHPARHEVELELIPDPEYRNAMAQAQMQAGGNAFAAAGWSLEGAPGVTQEPPEMPPNPGPGVEGDGAGDGEGGGVLPWVAGGLIVTGVLWGGSKLVRRRRARW